MSKLSKEAVFGIVAAKLDETLRRYNVSIPAQPEMIHEAATKIARLIDDLENGETKS